MYNAVRLWGCHVSSSPLPSATLQNWQYSHAALLLFWIRLNKQIIGWRHVKTKAHQSGFKMEGKKIRSIQFTASSPWISYKNFFHMRHFSIFFIYASVFAFSLSLKLAFNLLKSVLIHIFLHFFCRTVTSASAETFRREFSIGGAVTHRTQHLKKRVWTEKLHDSCYGINVSSVYK